MGEEMDRMAPEPMHRNEQEHLDGVVSRMREIDRQIMELRNERAGLEDDFNKIRDRIANILDAAAAVSAGEYDAEKTMSVAQPVGRGR